MKQSKRKIRKTNIKKRTKKYNYRKNQRGGWGFFSSDPQIITAMMKFPGFENIQISFPFKNIQMDISLPDKLLNKALDEWGEVTCYNSIKQQLTDRNNQQKEMRMNNEILTIFNIQIADTLNFRVIPDIVAFITNPYDISIIGDKTKSSYSELVEKNNYVGGLLQPKQQESSSAASGPERFEITIPKEVPFLIRLMQQLTREIDTYIYYINGTKQPKFPIDEEEAKLHAGTYLYKTACKGYGNMLTNIRTMYRGDQESLDWSKVNIQILYCFLASSPFETYYSLNFVPKILQPAVAQGSYPEFFYAKAKRDGGGSLIPDVSIDWMIRNYKDYYIDSKFFNLDPITENAEDGNFLQYVKNGITILIKVDTSIIIEVVQIWYIYLTDIQAVARDGSNYNGLIIAAIVEKTSTDITGGVVHYSSQFRWLITKSTLQNLRSNNITLPDPILRNLEEVRMSGDNRVIRFFKGSTSRGPPAAAVPANAVPANAATNAIAANANAAGFPDQEHGKLYKNKGINLQEDYIDADGNLKPRNPNSQWQDSSEYEPEEGDIDNIGGKKNKTRRKLKKSKRTKKRKTKY